DSTLPFAQWLAERVAPQSVAEDSVLAECTSLFDVDTLAELTQGTFTVTPLTVSPACFGEPVERKRLYTVLPRAGRLQWHPSPSGD
ncbi:unnamed protein product, partial [Effrenium voratum]